ncbi:MAG: hypothetical protein EOO93_14190 [Pedobacter sp.]|nr:MAG: hypothetical protein EOO93_14190 [Pedobacter sp.]
MKKEWSLYLDKNIEELKTIEPNWAYGKHYRKARYTQELLNVGCNIFHVKLAEIIKYADFGEVRLDKLFHGENNNDKRIAEIIYRWDNSQFVDPPHIYLDIDKKTILFSDGRHRTKTAYLLGQLQIPIIVSIDDVLSIKQLLALSTEPF